MKRLVCSDQLKSVIPMDKIDEVNYKQDETSSEIYIVYNTGFKQILSYGKSFDECMNDYIKMIFRNN